MPCFSSQLTARSEALDLMAGTVKMMNDENSRLLLAALKEISDNQQLQLALQREQFALVQRQAERHEVIQDRAEKIQAKSAQIMAVARRTLFVILPIVTLLILYVSWLLFRY
jgi:hypothetical protein